MKPCEFISYEEVYHRASHSKLKAEPDMKASSRAARFIDSFSRPYWLFG